MLIPGFEPAKYHTKYDSYLDKALLALQDEFLKDDSVVFAVSVDLTGNRTKRIFNDEIGIQAAHNTEPAFQQVYHRDTGVTMWDISSPIYVKGQHWGGFRIGFSLGKIEAAKQQLQLKLFGIMGGILLVSLIVVFVTVNKSLQPLTRITEMASSLANGNLNQPIQIRGRDEISQLADVLERLRLSIQTAMKRLSRKNKEGPG